METMTANLAKVMVLSFHLHNYSAVHIIIMMLLDIMTFRLKEHTLFLSLFFNSIIIIIHQLHSSKL